MSSRWFWIAAALVTAAALFWAGTSDAVYDITSPPRLSLHVLFRKAYSIVAFALVGFTAERAFGSMTRGANLLRATLLVAVYSGAIEVVQALRGSHEGAAWNAVDIVCGGIGGWLGARSDEFIRRSRRKT